jgi:hypothetical protein
MCKDLSDFHGGSPWADCNYLSIAAPAEAIQQGVFHTLKLEKDKVYAYHFIKAYLSGYRRRT